MHPHDRYGAASSCELCGNIGSAKKYAWHPALTESVYASQPLGDARIATAQGKSSQKRKVLRSGRLSQSAGNTLSDDDVRICEACGQSGCEVDGRLDTSPDLEVVDVPRESSFKAWAHGYPFRTVRWHFHPEYEIHLVTETCGRSFIGDYIGTFEPGNLVMTGPNLPHNWISDIEKGQVVAQRGLVVQFTHEFIQACIATMPELRSLEPVLAASGSGVEFADGVGASVRPVIEQLLAASGPERISLFFHLLSVLRGSEFHQLASASYRSRPENYVAEPLNHVLDHIARNLCSDLRQAELAELSGFTPSAFSRAFKQHTGLTFVRYVNRLRIDRGCELLRNSEQGVADICFEVGFNNLSNFNRHFIALRGMPPSVFRRLHRQNATQFIDPSPHRMTIRSGATMAPDGVRSGQTIAPRR
ncbi:AraC-like DNA-binding protein [Hyphomicrobiales bacterium]|nr:AraC-like DNA-binding protein [Hyphomicrobiales bacterium]CAH1692384.1 AraC-like DNA-binding protein [Hyphomicrobiales bacterium]